VRREPRVLGLAMASRQRQDLSRHSAASSTDVSPTPQLKREWVSVARIRLDSR
jgi:hypothetical protein